MTHHVRIARTLDKKLQTMRRAGKKGELAATQCERLLEQIRREGLLVEEVYRKRTKNGEYRISNCIKYDLGNGYRLITVKDRQNLFVPFVGGHDETDLWLEHHRYDVYLPDDPAYVDVDISTADCQPKIEEPENLNSEELSIPDAYEEQLLAKMDETLLKSLFPGLFHKQQP